MPGLLRQVPAVRPRVPAQRQHVIQRHRDAAPLPHHPGQHRPDQRVRPRPAVSGIFYAGRCGRGVVSCFVTNSRNASRPPRVTRPPAHAAVITQRHISREPAITQTSITQALSVKQRRARPVDHALPPGAPDGRPGRLAHWCAASLTGTPRPWRAACWRGAPASSRRPTLREFAGSYPACLQSWRDASTACLPAIPENGGDRCVAQGVAIPGPASAQKTYMSLSHSSLTERARCFHPAG